MFTVDLLKGQGIPLKNRPEGLAMVAVGAVVPVIIAISMLWSYFYNRAVIPIWEHEFVVCNDKIKTLSEGVKIQQAFYNEKDSINKAVPQAAIAVRKFTQWSPIIRVIAENMPGAMVLSQFEGKQSTGTSQEAANSDSKTGGAAVSVKREIGINISGSAKASWDEEVKSFRNRLLSSDILKSRVEDISVPQQSSRGGEKESTSYEMRVIFKSGM